MNLISYLEKNKIWHHILEKEDTVHTADAAAATGIPLERVTKSLVFLADKKPILVIIPGTHRADLKKVKNALNIHEIHIVPFTQVKEYTGYLPGATPPIHHKQIADVVIDKTVMLYETVYGGGGSRNILIELRTKDIQQVNSAKVADIITNTSEERPIRI
jgi:Cys-tRNA(Pro)/Cys-tRNA(Cys) deacylase